MDGTVLDLHFDNVFWLELLPRRWGAARGLDPVAALAELKPLFDARRGTLEWYCVDHWSEQLGFDVPALKHELRHQIRYLDGAAEFLDLLRSTGKRTLLTTNAHPLSLRVKDAETGLSRHFDELVSSHEFGVPKESPLF
ncbi:MAG: hydrolase, haloacid dehalogenase-like family, partial [Steroidobacteraceae bacterium]|nr:hydrolase, haloacid dehalogenase-like family [Steroidobacteraceae bacterium]